MKPHAQNSLRWIVTIAVISILLLVGWYYTRPKPILVEWITVSTGDVEATIVNTRAGTVKACQRSNLAPASGGQIAKIWIKEGDRVQAGQVLLELWNHDLQAQRDLAQRQLTTAQERRREACILADNAQREYIRTQQLLSKSFVSPQRVDDTRANANSRRASC